MTDKKARSVLRIFEDRYPLFIDCLETTHVLDIIRFRLVSGVYKIFALEWFTGIDLEEKAEDP